MNARKLALVGLGMTGVAALVWLVGGSAYARYREKQVEAEWVRSFGTRQQLLDRYPKTTTNGSTQLLERLAKQLELDLTPKTADSITADASASRSARERRELMSRYLKSQLEKSEATIDPPPPEVRDFLADHAKDVSAIVDTLTKAEPLRWNFDPGSLRGRQPIPDVYGLIGLQRLLLADALVTSATRNSTAASRMLDASWKLNQPLREIPDVMCQLIALAIARLQVGALRKVEVDATVWRPRLAEYDFKRSILDTQLLVIWPSAARHRELLEIDSRRAKPLLERLRSTFEEPNGDIVWSQVLEKMRLSYLHVKDSPLLDKEIWGTENGSNRNAADAIFSIQMPNLLDSFRRVDRLVIESELTDKILQARSLRRENNLRWPAAVAGIEATRFPGARWIYAVSPQGTMTLSLSEEPKWGASGLVLPCRFTSS
jgi:hypothetical protein